VTKSDISKSDDVCKAIFAVFKEFKDKIDEFTTTKNEEILSNPALSTDIVTTEVIGKLLIVKLLTKLTLNL
jgi:hypothetical protein